MNKLMRFLMSKQNSTAVINFFFIDEHFTLRLGTVRTTFSVILVYNEKFTNRHVKVVNVLELSF